MAIQGQCAQLLQAAPLLAAWPERAHALTTKQVWPKT